MLFLIHTFFFNTDIAYAKKRIPIMASHTIRAGHNTIENYRAIEEAGFTLAKESYPSLDEAVEHLKTASKTKVKLIIECPELSKNIEYSVNCLSKFNSFGGYDISDEPGAALFEKIGNRVQTIQSLDGIHYIWVNLFPIYAELERLQTSSYEDYVEKYIEKVNPPFVSFDCYGITKTQLRTNYYHNLEVVSQKCKKAGLPFWAYVLASQFGNYAEPTKGTLSFQAYNNLAYGAQGIEYFCYRQIVQKGLNITISPIDTNYQKMPVYYDVKELNCEIGYYSKVFYGNDVKDVSFLGKTIPEGTKPTTTLPNGIKLSNYGGKGFLASYFTNGKHEYLMFVNQDYVEPQVIEIESKRRIKRLSYYRKERMRASGKLTFEAQPGSMILLCLS